MAVMTRSADADRAEPTAQAAGKGARHYTENAMRRKQWITLTRLASAVPPRSTLSRLREREGARALWAWEG